LINFEIFLGVGNFEGDLVGFVGNCVGVKRVPDDDIRITALCNAALPATAPQTLNSTTISCCIYVAITTPIETTAVNQTICFPARFFHPRWIGMKSTAQAHALY
jgi:hypothetical protein